MKRRAIVERFADDMERVLRANERKGKRGWRVEGPDWLLERLRDETNELERAITLRLESRTIRREAADVANFAMFLAEVSG